MYQEKIRPILRLVRAFNYLALVIIIVPIIFSTPAKRLPKRRELASFLYRRFYNALNVKLIVKGTPTATPSLWTCNHISWLDVLLLAGNNTVDFIAKTEVGEWPIVGSIVKKSGTILIHRENKFQAYRSLPQLQERMQSGSSILVFPEGTTTDGRSTLPFKPMFYQVAIREKAMIQPIVLQYFDSNGEITDSVAFLGEEDFLTSFKRILKQPKIIASIHFLPTLPAHEYHRKQLAEVNQQAINHKLMQNSNANSQIEGSLIKTELSEAYNS